MIVWNETNKIFFYEVPERDLKKPFTSQKMLIKPNQGICEETFPGVAKALREFNKEENHGPTSKA